MIKAGVLGAPVAHSLSPRLHGSWLRKYGIDGAYTLFETPAAALAARLKRLADDGYAGCNLTLPLKEAALALMDECDDSATAAGAVNTVVFRDGKAIGHNSDGFGFVASLKARHPAWKKEHVVLLGAGGAARGIAAALKKEGVTRFTIINRTPERAGRLIEALALPGAAAPWGAPIQEASLLVNCTSLGMEGQPALAVDISGLRSDAVVCDIVYRPLATPLLTAARARGLATVPGLPMLLHQGRLGFRLWFGVDPAVTKELEEDIAACAGK